MGGNLTVKRKAAWRPTTNSPLSELGHTSVQSAAAPPTQLPVVSWPFTHLQRPAQHAHYHSRGNERPAGLSLLMRDRARGIFVVTVRDLLYRVLAARPAGFRFISKWATSTTITMDLRYVDICPWLLLLLLLQLRRSVYTEAGVSGVEALLLLAFTVSVCVWNVERWVPLCSFEWTAIV